MRRENHSYGLSGRLVKAVRIGFPPVTQPDVAGRRAATQRRYQRSVSEALGLWAQGGDRPPPARVHGKVIVIERGPGDVTEQLENALEEPIGDDLRSLGRRIGDGCFDLSPVAMVSDDASLRAQILTLIAKRARCGISGPVSLICDDGQDLLPVLLKILAPRPRDLHVTVAWTPLGTSDDVAMMQRCPYLHSFPQKHLGIATVLAEELNRRNELAE
jgi:hypothetical protein